jgi:hypothetical protein
MTTLSEALQDVCDLLAGAGVAAVVNPADLDIPGAWVTPGEISYNTLSPDTFGFTMSIYLVAGDLPAKPALDALGSMLTKSAQALGAQLDATPVTLTLANHSAGPLPGLLFTLETQVD